MKRLACIGVFLAACGGDDGGPTGSPPELGTTPKTWEYVPITGAQCMNGSATGIGVNLGTSGDVVIYMEGGGACFNDETCRHVAHPGGFGPAEFDANINIYNVGIFDRIDDANPFQDATYVFVPYCTGDPGPSPTAWAAACSSATRTSGSTSITSSRSRRASAG